MGSHGDECTCEECTEIWEESDCSCDEIVCIDHDCECEVCHYVE